jgi:hypothetical protein
MHIIALTTFLTIRRKRRYRDASDAAVAIHISAKRVLLASRRRRGRDAPWSGTNQLLKLPLHDTRRHCHELLGLKSNSCPYKVHLARSPVAGLHQIFTELPIGKAATVATAATAAYHMQNQTLQQAQEDPLFGESGNSSIPLSLP